MAKEKLLFSEGFLYGYGLFETMKSYHGKIFVLDEHLKRMTLSAKKIDLKIPFSKLTLKKALIKEASKPKIKSLPQAYIRLNLWKNNHSANFNIISRKYQPHAKTKYKKGLDLNVSSYIINVKSPLAAIKSLNYLNFYLAYKDAKKHKFDESILLNTEKQIAECTRSNIFLVTNHKVFTPHLKSACLPGITRDLIIKICKDNGIKIKETYLKPRDLNSADEIFITNSLIEIMPVKKIKNLFKGRVNKYSITKRISALYKELTRQSYLLS